jgi:uncharacterized protein YceH (UPF0502 family)
VDDARELVAALPRHPGERGQRYAHRLSEADAEGASGVPADRAAPARVASEGASALPAAPDDGLAARLGRLEDEVAALREQLGALRSELGA